jgi:hypothetical protein
MEESFAASRHEAKIGQSAAAWHSLIEVPFKQMGWMPRPADLRQASQGRDLSLDIPFYRTSRLTQDAMRNSV